MSITDELRRYISGPAKSGISRICANALTNIADRIDAAADLEKAGWVMGPLDADGEIWHSGDMSDSNWGEIEGIAYEDGTWYVKGHDTSAPWIRADNIRHYHKPTVEDVLREFAEKVTDSQIPGTHPTYEEAIAEYAAKLRLADDRKEQ